MNRRAVLVTVVAAVILLCTGLWLARRGPGYHATPYEPSGSALRADVPEGASAVSDHGAAQKRTVPAITRRVRSASGVALADATVILVSTGSAIGGRPASTDQPSGSSVTRLPVDDLAIFELPSGNVASERSLFVLHPSHEAKCYTIGRGEHGYAGVDDPIVLAAVQPLTANVREAEGTAASGTVVSQRFVTSHWAGSAEPEGALRGLAALEWQSITGEDGIASLFPSPWKTTLVAVRGTSASAPWTGRSPAAVQLVLRESFEVAGEVRGIGTSSLPPDARVECWIQIEDELEPIGVERVLAGRFGPRRLPIVPAQGYVLRLSGSGLARVEHRIESPRAGDSVRVTLDAVAAAPATILVSDPDGGPVPGALVLAHWNAGKHWIRLERRTTSGGIASFEDADVALAFLRVQKDGFAPKLVDVSGSVHPGGPPFEVRLERGGRVDVRVLHAGIPVEDFVLTYWGANPSEYARREVVGADGGMHRIDDAPIGAMTILATSGPWPRSDAKVIDVPPDAPASVELLLESPLHGIGQVVDGLTRLPIVEATVQAFVEHAGMRRGASGAPIPVDVDGHFTLESCSPGENGILVRAPGYAMRSAQATGKGGAPLDFGLIALDRTQAIEVRLRSASDLEWTGYQAELRGIEVVAPRPFPSSGVLRWDGLAPYAYTLLLTHPDHSFSQHELRLRAGRDLELELPVEDRSLRVRVLHDDDSAPGWIYLKVAAALPGFLGGSRDTWIPPEGEVEIGGLPSGRAVLQLSDPDSVPLLAQEIEIPESADATVELHLSGAARTVLVVDRSGQPVGGADVIWSSPKRVPAWHKIAKSDASGRVTIGRVNLEDLWVGAYHTSLGLAPSRPCETLDREGCRIVLDGSSRLRANLIERGQPAVGVNVRGTDRTGFGYGVEDLSTNSEGYVEWGPVAAGEVRIEVDHPGYFPIALEVSTPTPTAGVAVEVRRTGSLSIVAKDAYAQIVVGAHVELESIESQRDVRTWIAAGSVVTSSSDLATNANGVLTLHGLPNGAYRWHLTTDTPAWAEGEVVVPPHAQVQLEVVAR